VAASSASASRHLGRRAQLHAVLDRRRLRPLFRLSWTIPVTDSACSDGPTLLPAAMLPCEHFCTAGADAG